MDTETTIVPETTPVDTTTNLAVKAAATIAVVVAGVLASGVVRRKLEARKAPKTETTPEEIVNE